MKMIGGEGKHSGCFLKVEPTLFADELAKKA
jgi:hypothetical protein